MLILACILDGQIAGTGSKREPKWIEKGAKSLPKQRPNGRENGYEEQHAKNMATRIPICNLQYELRVRAAHWSRKYSENGR